MSPISWWTCPTIAFFGCLSLLMNFPLFHNHVLCLKFFSTELTASDECYLTSPWISGKLYMFSYNRHCSELFINIFVDFKPTSCRFNNGDILAHEILYWFYTEKNQSSQCISFPKKLLHPPSGHLGYWHSWATIIHDTVYKHITASLDNVIKTYQNFYLKEQNQLNVLLQK
jgi:hypothetical protein